MQIGPVTISSLALATSLASPLVQASDRAEAIRDVVTGLAFFGGLILLLIVTLVLRLRDARVGLSAEERQARLRRRLPWVMGVFFGLVIMVLLGSM